MRPGPRVLALTGEPDPSAWWRIIRPIARLAEQGYPAHWSKWEPGLVEKLAAAGEVYDVIVLSRLYWPDHAGGARIVEGLRETGAAVLYEVDDDWYSPGVSERMQEALQMPRSLEWLEQEREHRIFAVQQVDGVIVSSARLGQVVASYTAAPVEIVPNAIDGDWWLERLNDSAGRRFVSSPSIGWLGGPRLNDDLEPVAEAWGRIAQRFPAVQFVVTGEYPGGVAAQVPSDRVWPIPWQTVEALPGTYLEIDIACCSVSANHWNEAKTPIKVFEATMSGAVVVASPTLYGDVVSHYTDGIIAESAQEWELALVNLLENPDTAARLRRAQLERTIAEHSLMTQAWRWPAAWARLHHAAKTVAV